MSYTVPVSPWVRLSHLGQPWGALVPLVSVPEKSTHSTKGRAHKLGTETILSLINNLNRITSITREAKHKEERDKEKLTLQSYFSSMGG